MRSTHHVGMAIALVLFAVAAATAEEVKASVDKPSCDGMPGYHRLDFWIGEWKVFEGDELAGYNRIEKVPSGCAIEEHWTSATGGAGQSLFFFDPQRDCWHQVWVTGTAFPPGGMKEKAVLAFHGEGVIGSPLKSRLKTLDNPHLQAIPNVEAFLTWNNLTVKLLVVVCCDNVLLESVRATAETLDRFGLREGMAPGEVAKLYGEPVDRRSSTWTYEDSSWEVGANRLVLEFGAAGLESATWSYFLD